MDGVELTISNLHVGERMWSYADPEDVLKPYNNIDVKIGLPFTFNASGKVRMDCRMDLEINDLLNEQYEHIPRYPMPGRNFKATLTIAL